MKKVWIGIRERVEWRVVSRLSGRGVGLSTSLSLPLILGFENRDSLSGHGAFNNFPNFYFLFLFFFFSGKRVRGTIQILHVA